VDPIHRVTERSIPMQRILLAYDGTDAARKALDTAATFATTFGASVTVVSVVPRHPGRSPIDPWDDGQVHAQELRDAASVLRERGVPFDLLEPSGDVPRTIERIALEGDYDLIVIGSRNLGSVERLLMGSVSEHVAQHAATTVVVAR
jgi:nucleotide-binding universal stress UspA family protein